MRFPVLFLALLAVTPPVLASPRDPSPAPERFYAWHLQTHEVRKLATTGLGSCYCPNFAGGFDGEQVAWGEFEANESGELAATRIRIAGPNQQRQDVRLDGLVERFSLDKQILYYNNGVIQDEASHGRLQAYDLTRQRDIPLPLNLTWPAMDGAVAAWIDRWPDSGLNVYDFETQRFIVHNESLPNANQEEISVEILSHSGGLVVLSYQNKFHAYDLTDQYWLPATVPPDLSFRATRFEGTVYWMSHGPYHDNAFYAAPSVTAQPRLQDRPPHPVFLPLTMRDGWLLLAAYSETDRSFLPAPTPLLIGIAIAMAMRMSLGHRGRSR